MSALGQLNCLGRPRMESLVWERKEEIEKRKSVLALLRHLQSWGSFRILRTRTLRGWSVSRKGNRAGEWAGAPEEPEFPVNFCLQSLKDKGIQAVGKWKVQFHPSCCYRNRRWKHWSSTSITWIGWVSTEELQEWFIFTDYQFSISISKVLIDLLYSWCLSCATWNLKGAPCALRACLHQSGSMLLGQGWNPSGSKLHSVSLTTVIFTALPVPEVLSL